MAGDTKYASYSLLVVDDHRTMLQIVQGLLRQIGFVNIDMATDGVQAMAAMEKKRYDLIISDWNMPNMDGLEFLKRVRSSANNQVKAVPFIMVTAETKAQNIVAAKQAGVNNYIIKPLAQATLKQKIDATLGLM